MTKKYGVVAGVTLTLGTGPEPLSLVPAVRAQVDGPTRDQPVYAVRTMEQTVSRSLAGRRFTMLVVFAAAALLLGGIVLAVCYIPARRATALDPLAALRCE